MRKELYTASADLGINTLSKMMTEEVGQENMSTVDAFSLVFGAQEAYI